LARYLHSRQEGASKFAGLYKQEKGTAMTENAFRTARLHKILGNPLRYRILCELIENPRTPSELARLTHRPIDAVSRNLTLLSLAGLVTYQTHGHCVVYSVKFEDLAAVLALAEAFTRAHNLPAANCATDPVKV
jgi:predicted transcriptional regulator